MFLITYKVSVPTILSSWSWLVSTLLLDPAPRPLLTSSLIGYEDWTGTLLNIVSLSLSFIPDIVTLLILSHVYFYCHSIWTSQLDFRRAQGVAQSGVCPGPGCSGWWTTWCWPLARGHFLYMAQSLHFSWICLWNIGQQLVSPSLGTWKMNEVWYPSQDTRCSQNFCITIGCDL